MTTVTVGSAWTPPENYFAGDDGTYRVTLIQIGVTDRQTGEFAPGATRSYEGQFGTKVVQDWTFALEDGSIIETSVGAPRRAADGRDIIHPKSTFYGFLTALAGKPIAEGVEFDPQTHLIGREALATIQRDDKGYPRIISLGALPTSPMSTAHPKPAVRAAAPLREQVAAADALPF